MFKSFGPLILHEQYGWSPQIAGLSMSLFGVGALGSPLCGILADKFAELQFLVIFASSIVYIIAFYGFATGLFDPLYCLIAVVATYIILEPIIWSSPSRLLKNSVTGTGYGIVSLMNSLFLSIAPFVFGEARRQTLNYYWPLIGCCVSFCVGGLCSFLNIFLTFGKTFDNS